MKEEKDQVYTINPNFSENEFNDIEKANIEAIRDMENMTKPLLLSDCLE